MAPHLLSNSCSRREKRGIIVFVETEAGNKMKKTVAMSAAMSILIAAALPFTAAAEDTYPHYLEENESRYETYGEKNPNLPRDVVLAYVNANVDLGFYNGIETVENPDSKTVLVNKNFALPTGYEPGNLVSLDGGFQLRGEAAAQFGRMRTDMNAMGYRIYLIATYRTYQTQAGRYSNAVGIYGRDWADLQFARGGHSEHQTGFAIDILHTTGIPFMVDARFENTREYTWLRNNAHRYGYILRYPREEMDIHGFLFEPWHWRYVGVAIATAMYDEGITLYEEYYGRYLAPGVIEKREVEIFKHYYSRFGRYFIPELGIRFYYASSQFTGDSGTFVQGSQ